MKTTKQHADLKENARLLLRDELSAVMYKLQMTYRRLPQRSTEAELNLEARRLLSQTLENLGIWNDSAHRAPYRTEPPTKEDARQ